MPALLAVADPVAGLGVGHHGPVGLARALQGVGHLQHVLEVNVVVHHAVVHVQVTGEVTGALQARGRRVALGVELGRRHVALGVDRVVHPPVVDAAARDAEGELVRREQRVGAHEAAVAVAGETDPRGVGPVVGAQPVDRVADVGQLRHAELLVAGADHVVTLAARAAHVDVEADDAVLGEELGPAAIVPAVAHGRRVRTGVGHQPDRVLLGRVEGHGLEHRGVQQAAVARGDLVHFPLGHEHALVRSFARTSLGEGVEDLAVSGAEAHLLGHVEGRHAVDEVGPRLVPAHAVAARALGQAHEAFSVEADAVQVGARRAALGGLERDAALLLVDGDDAAHGPVPCGDRVLELAVLAVVVDVLLAGARAGPQEAVVVEVARQGGALGPGLRLLADEGLDLASRGVVQVHVAPGLDAVLDHEQAAAIVVPADAHDQEFAALLVLREVGPLHLAGRRLGDAQLDGRVRVAGLGVVGDLALDAEGPVLDVVDDGEGVHGLLVGGQERDVLAVRREPEGLEVAATVELLLVDPVELAVEELVAAVVGHAGDHAALGVEQVEVIVLDPPGDAACV